MGMVQFGKVLHRCRERRTGSHQPYIAYCAFEDFPEPMISIECKTKDAMIKPAKHCMQKKPLSVISLRDAQRINSTEDGT